MSEWTKGRGPQGSGPGVGEGCFFPPHLSTLICQRLGNSDKLLLKIPAQGHEGSTQGAPGVSVKVHWIFEPSEALPKLPSQLGYQCNTRSTLGCSRSLYFTAPVIAGARHAPRGDRGEAVRKCIFRKLGFMGLAPQNWLD